MRIGLPAALAASKAAGVKGLNSAAETAPGSAAEIDSERANPRPSSR